MKELTGTKVWQSGSILGKMFFQFSPLENLAKFKENWKNVGKRFAQTCLVATQ